MPPFLTEALSVGALFSGNRLYYVPEFQRPVSWGADDASKLLGDLWLALGDTRSDPASHPYYFGNIVLCEPRTGPGPGASGRSDGRPGAAIVDGQQRMVAFTLLFSVLRDLIGESEPWLAGMIADGDTIRLVAGLSEAQFLKDYVQRPGSALGPIGSGVGGSGTQNIREMRTVIVGDFNDRSAEELSHFARFLRDHCWISVVVTPDIEQGFRIFAKLNTRGQPLKETEIVKSMALASLGDSERRARTQRWTQLRRRAKASFEGLPSHIQAIYVTQRQSILRDNLKLMEGPGGAAHYLDAIFFPLAEVLGSIAAADFRGSSEAAEINRLLRYLNLLGGQDWLPPVLAFLSVNGRQPPLVLEFLRQFDRLAHGLLIAAVKAERRTSRYRALAHAIVKSPGALPEERLLALSADERRTAYHNATTDLQKRGRNGICKLTLLRLSGVADRGPFTRDLKKITVEHVLPKSPRAGSRWLTLFPDPEERRVAMQTLGNLILLPDDVNIGAKNLEFAEKRSVYFPGRRPTQLAITDELLDIADWTPEVISARNRRLLARIAETWHIMPPGEGT